MRYTLVEEAEGTWAVWDTQKQRNANELGTPAVHMTKEHADDLHAILESLHLRRELISPPRH
jgi:hypothetical protein